VAATGHSRGISQHDDRGAAHGDASGSSSSASSSSSSSGRVISHGETRAEHGESRSGSRNGPVVRRSDRTGPVLRRPDRAGRAEEAGSRDDSRPPQRDGTDFLPLRSAARSRVPVTAGSLVARLWRARQDASGTGSGLATSRDAALNL
jgi:hypothetical protein